MPEMLSSLGLELQGRHHSGIDDARNIARCAAVLDDLAQKSGKEDIWLTERRQL